MADNSVNDGGTDGVRIDTTVDNLSVEIGGDGGLFVNEQDDITLASIDSAGRVVVGADGSITAQSVQVAAGGGNDVRLTASDTINIESLDAGRSDLFLTAGNDVLSVGSQAPIVGTNLTVRADNSTLQGADGIQLATDVETLDALSLIHI